MCDCNESSFEKLRECWSRHFKEDKAKCSGCCCCQKANAPKAKVKGKFGVAYVIDTPTRKCKPCGWEVEFNDTPSKIEYNCKKMMNWIICPPLAECQDLRCCTCNVPKDAMNIMKNMCCKCAEKTPCTCSRDRKTNEGDSCYFAKDRKTCGGGNICYKKPQRKCRSAPTRCCATIGQQVYLQSKNQCSCCRPQSCCCEKSPVRRCCQNDCSSDEELNYCCDQYTSCNCNCANCQCSTKKVTASMGVQKSSNDQLEKPSGKPSKNLLSPDWKNVKLKAQLSSLTSKSDFSMPKKGPDKTIEWPEPKLIKRKIKRNALLKMIKDERKKEIEAINELKIPKIVSDIPIRKGKLPMKKLSKVKRKTLLKMNRQQKGKKIKVTLNP